MEFASIKYYLEGNIDINFLKNKIIKLSNHRLIHSYSTAITCFKLAKKYNFNSYIAYLTGLFHDLERENKNIDVLDHGKEASKYFKEPIKTAIASHVLGNDDNLLSKILFVADFIEPTRKFKEAKLFYNYAFKDLDKTFYKIKEFKNNLFTQSK